MRVAAFIVKGRPVSIQAHAASRRRWMSRVQEAARGIFSQPLTDFDLKVQITFFYDEPPTFDMDNVSKPICDALNGIAYNDDRQLMERNSRKRYLKGSYHLEGVDPELVRALAESEEFVYIEITKVGEELHYL